MITDIQQAALREIASLVQRYGLSSHPDDVDQLCNDTLLLLDDWKAAGDELSALRERVAALTAELRSLRESNDRLKMDLREAEAGLTKMMRLNVEYVKQRNDADQRAEREQEREIATAAIEFVRAHDAAMAAGVGRGGWATAHQRIVRIDATNRANAASDRLSELVRAIDALTQSPGPATAGERGE